MYEITQIKGDGETHPALSPNDEFANFEKWDAANLAGVPKQPGMIEREYARQALAEGLKLEAALGVNPFKFGFVERHGHAYRPYHRRRGQLLRQAHRCRTITSSLGA